MMRSKIDSFTELSDQTYIKLFTAISAGIATAVFVFYVTIVYSEVGQATLKNIEQDKKIDALQEMKTDIAVIKSILENKTKNQ